MSTVAALKASKAWGGLDRELDAWAVTGVRASLWVRDDDAIAATPALNRLSALSREAAIPVCVAVIPSLMEPSLAGALDLWPEATVVQHGFAHVSHSAAGEKKAEFSEPGTPPARRRELTLGKTKLCETFAGRFVPMLVPPWNRIHDDWRSVLPQLGYSMISTFKPRQKNVDGSWVQEVNCHVDIVDWRGTRGFVGIEPVLESLTAHLRYRRLNAVDEGEPTGILAHHLVHDEACWAFLEVLFRQLGEDSRVEWLPVSRIGL